MDDYHLNLESFLIHRSSFHLPIIFLSAVIIYLPPYLNFHRANPLAYTNHKPLFFLPPANAPLPRFHALALEAT